MARKGGLGSGLGALFGEEIKAQQENALPGAPAMLPITKVEPRPDQPRKEFDEEALEELAESIRAHGLIQPVVVRPLLGDYYQIIAGERRWRAARLAGLEEIPVRVLEADDRLAMELALVENLQREDLNPIEEAKGYCVLMEEYDLTQEEVSAAVGRSRSAVANALRLLSLANEVQKLVADGKLSAGHARALIPLRGERAQERAAETIISERLSVRQTEALCARLARSAEPRQKRRTPGGVDSIDYAKEVERELENLLGRKVTLVDGRKKGHIELEFYGAEDREKLIENLKLFGSLRRK